MVQQEGCRSNSVISTRNLKTMSQSLSNPAARSEINGRDLKPAQITARQTASAKGSLEGALRDPKAIIRLRKLLGLLGVSRSTVYLRISPQSKYYDPKFPKSIRLGAKSVGWILADVYAYIDHLRNRDAFS